MAFTFTQVVIDTLTLTVNPSKAAKPREFLQTTFRSIDGTMQVTYIPQTGDATKIKIKRRFDLSGQDPDGSVIEAIEAVIAKAPPLSFTNSEGETVNVAVESFNSDQDAELWEERPWSLSLVEM